MLDLSDRILHRAEDLPLVKKWIADSQSWDPATTDFNRNWLPSYQGSREALMVIFLLTYLQDWETWEITKRIADQCYRYRYEGNWEQVQVFLEQVTDLSSFYTLFRQRLGNDDDFFGNFVKECDKFLRKNPKAFKDDSKMRRPKAKVRRRGYQDKGSLRPYHKRGRNLPDPEPGEDRRWKIKIKNTPYTENSNEGNPAG